MVTIKTHGIQVSIDEYANVSISPHSSDGKERILIEVPKGQKLTPLFGNHNTGKYRPTKIRPSIKGR